MAITIKKPSDLAPYIDHTNVKIDATQKDIEKLCEEAKKYHFCTVVVRGNGVEAARHLLAGTNIRVCATVGLPKASADPGNCHFGSMPTSNKMLEAGEALEDGAEELDMVINLDALRNCDYELVKKDISSIKKLAGQKILKVIIESRLLTKDQLTRACQLSQEAGADFIKTSTGYLKDDKGNTLGATVEDVKCIRAIVGANIGVKASGGIKDFASAKALIEAGANRIGSSASVDIVRA
ncbi:deoxyribose-phosphate aldolase [Candidatus Saganbacteria bacterium]|nr:deoxyribose-phosphate aldolase [Candidatus Saganbacteria bacterium]